MPIAIANAISTTPRISIKIKFKKLSIILNAAHVHIKNMIAGKMQDII